MTDNNHDYPVAATFGDIEIIDNNVVHYAKRDNKELGICSICKYYVTYAGLTAPEDVDDDEREVYNQHPVQIGLCLEPLETNRARMFFVNVRSDQRCPRWEHKVPEFTDDAIDDHTQGSEV